MTISKTFTEKKILYKEIELPYYVEYEKKFYAVFSENNVVMVRPDTCNYCTVIKSDLGTFKREVSEGIECDKALFDEAFETVVNKMKAIVIPPFKS